MNEIHQRAASAPVLDVNQRQRIVTVVAVPWLQRARVPFRGEIWAEVFERGAFSAADLMLDPHRVRVNREHNPSLAVGKAVHFDTSDPRGLIADLQLSRTTLGDETLALAEDQALSASIGFGVLPGGEARDRYTKTRKITQAVLDHIALVQAPAYVGAAVLAVRSARTPSGISDYYNDPVVAWAKRRVRR